MKTNEVYTDLEGFGNYEGGDHKPLDEQVNRGSLYHWVFHFNEYTGLWNAVHRDHYNSYWSDHNAAGVIGSKSIRLLTEIIQKTDGDIKKIEKLISEQ